VASTFVVSVVVVLMEASLRYVDGKTLMGIGTRASKSRLPGFTGALLSNSFQLKGIREKTKGFKSSMKKGRFLKGF
jgi:hypothetical protein